MRTTLDPIELFEDVPVDSPVIVAVSGGSDSIALLHLASSWAKSCGADLRVVTVDHGLRPEAAAEAGFVSGICEGLLLQHYTLAWEGIKPTTGVSQAARDARYMLIEEFAMDIGSSTVLTGHTMDDQAETLWMRNSRDGGSPQHRGLSGMAPRMVLPNGIVVMRPFLGVRRSELRSHLADIGQSWVEDPSNFDGSYERVRARQALAASDLDIVAVSRFAQINGRLRETRCRAVRDLLVANLVVGDGPVYSLKKHLLGNCDSNNAILAVQTIIALAGGKEHFVPHERAKACLDLESGQRMTAGGCVIEVRKGSLTFYRETRNLPTIRLEPGERRLWDGRLFLENTSGQSFICRAMDKGEIRQFEQDAEKKFTVKPRAVLLSMPVIFNAMEGPLFPITRTKSSVDGLTWRLQFPAIEYYCSGYDLALVEVANYVRDQMGIIVPHRDQGFKSP